MKKLVEVARSLDVLIEDADDLPITGRCSKEGLNEMTNEIVSRKLSKKKAYKRIGWIESCLILGGAVTEEELKEIIDK